MIDSLILKSDDRKDQEKLKYLKEALNSPK